MSEAQNHTTPGHSAGWLWPRVEVVALFGGAAATMFAILFTISQAVMAPPRDVRLADDHAPSTRSISAKQATASIKTEALR